MSARCPVRIHTEDGEIVKVWYGAHGRHTHESVPGKADAQMALAWMKLRAATTTETIRHIIQSGRNMLRIEQHCYLPTDEALGQTLRKNRRRANQQQMMRVTMHGDEFLRYEDDNMYIFAR